MKQAMMQRPRFSCQLLVLVALVAGGISGCRLDDRNKELTAKTVDGVWVKPGYGLIFQLSNTEAKVFNINPAGCVQQQHFNGAVYQKIRQSLQLTGNGEQLTMQGDQQLLGTLKRQTNLPERCRQPSNGQTDSAVNFEFFWQAMLAHYDFFSARGINWHDVYQQYKPLFANATKAQQLAYYQQIIQAILDAHLSLFADDGAVEISSLAPKGLFAQVLMDEAGAADFDATLLSGVTLLQQQTAAFLEAPGLQATSATDAIQYGRLPGNIGYIRVDRLDSLAGEALPDLNLVSLNELFKADVALARQAMQQVLTALADSNGLIVDLRFNLGGADPIALEIASHFNSQPERVIGAKAAGGEKRRDILLASVAAPYQKPVRVLTGGITTSAAEVLALAFTALPQVDLIGEATQGAMSDVLSHQLPNGWLLQMSNESYWDLAGRLLEVQGVQPDTVVYPYLSLDNLLQSSTALDVAMMQLGAAPLATPDAAAAQAALDALRLKFQLPGLSAAVVREGRVSAVFSSGMADLASQTPMTADTPVQVASISKTVLGTALAVKGIQLNDVLPKLPLRVDHPAADEEPLRWQALAQHRAGIIDNQETLGCSVYLLSGGASLLNELAGAACQTPLLSHQEFLRQYLQSDGSLYHSSNFAKAGPLVYSNTGTQLASLAFEQLVGGSFANWSADHLFAPLQLSQTFWPTSDNVGNAATLYLQNGHDQPMALPPYASSDYYAGTLHTSARDLATYLAAVASRNPKQPLAGLTPAQRKLLLGAEQGYQPGNDFPGLFWHRSGDFVGHTGAFAGSSSLMYHNLATDTGVLLLVNAGFMFHPVPDEVLANEFELARWQAAGTLYRFALGQKQP